LDYREKLACKKDHNLTVPVKLILKGTALIDVARCPQCHQSYKYAIPWGEKDLWLSIIAEGFQKCIICGADNKDNLQFAGTGVNVWRPYWYYSNLHERLKFVFTCNACGKRQAKVISSGIWSDISKSLEAVKKPTGQLQCPHCNATITIDDKICPNCHKEIVCSKCSKPIAPNARFCSNCGDPVELYEMPSEAGPPKEKLCPTCHQEYEDGQIFCSVCGQELICDKCGEEIQEGALFCVSCGDPVTKGDLSE